MLRKVAIDMRYVENPFSGLSRFSTNIFLNLLKNDLDNDIFYILLFPPRKLSGHLSSFLSFKKSNIKILYSRNKRGLQWKFPFFIFNPKLYYLLKKVNVDIFLSPYIDPPFLPGIKVIGTIHDLIFLKVHDYFNNFRIIKRLFSELRIILTLIYSQKILTVSETTKKLLIDRYKSLKFIKQKLANITVIYNGICKLNEKGYNSLDDIEFESDYILYVGDRRNHKNLFYTIELIKNYNIAYGKNLKLYIAGSKSYRNFRLQKCIDANFFVREFINPTDRYLDNLYKKCNSLILLSFDEGFGIPIIEAASRSKKVIMSDISIFREVAPSNSLFLDLDNKSQHLTLLHNYLEKKIELDAKFILNKWSWELSATRLKDLIKSMLVDDSQKKI